MIKYPDPQTAQEYVLWIIRLGHLFTKRLNRSLVDRFDITFHQVHILFYIYHCPTAVTLGDLAEKLMVSLPNVNTLIKRLQADGYVIKKLSTVDRRAHYLQITTKGKRFLALLRKAGPSPEMKQLGNFLKAIPSVQRRHFTKTLTELAEYLQVPS